MEASLPSLDSVRANRRLARHIWGNLPHVAFESLKELTATFAIQMRAGDLIWLQGKWYVTHSGLLHIAHRKHCSAIQVQPVWEFSAPSESRWAFRATVYKTRHCRGFVGYGDASPANVSPLVRGAEMRVAETRAVNRALRKAYGIGLCSVEELGSAAESAQPQRKQGSSHRNRPMETMAALRSATASARSSASISSIPSWLSPMRPIFAQSRLC